MDYSSACGEQPSSQQEWVKCARTMVDQGSGAHNCEQPANSFCGKCHLVKYCSPGCQKAHWPQHKLDCKSELRRIDWQPTWARQGRQPDFLGHGRELVSFGHLMFLWGNVPAYDILNLPMNEGSEYGEDLDLCFAASGDLRNLVKSVNGLPSNYRGNFTCVVNDLQPLVVARNVVLLIAAAKLPPSQASELMLHTWYSARLTPTMSEAMRANVRPLVADVISKISHKGDEILLNKTWTFGKQRVSVCLAKAQWISLLRNLDVKHTPSYTEASRRFIMLNDSRIDYRDRQLFRAASSRRLCYHRIRETGILLPFGTCLDSFNVSNPTLFDSENGRWVQKDSIDPLAGWPLREVLEAGARFAPRADLYGRLYIHIRATLEEFCRKSAALNIHYRLFGVNASTLATTLANAGLATSGFDRVEVSNIADVSYIGLEKVLSTLGVLLKRHNCHACLITLFMNAVEQMLVVRPDHLDVEGMEANMQKAIKFLGPPTFSNRYDPTVFRMLSAQDLFRDYDKAFAEYMKTMMFQEVARETGMRMKGRNTVISAWPSRLKKRHGQHGAQEEFDLLMESGLVGNERYVEWVRQL